MTEENKPTEEKQQSIGMLAFVLFGLPLIVIIVAAALGWI
jgi:hypothetical protein